MFESLAYVQGRENLGTCWKGYDLGCHWSAGSKGRYHGNVDGDNIGNCMTRALNSCLTTWG